ncbi:bcl-2-like protein 12 [Eublepharis macularius]|uniref:Bcl-2-like protein 12 n=1 Tax=Eublepharis macularius TaxID=481883 RepID=A0AA97K8L8_EUBMA|nr:bcl-2-like protein 12 [Eublepharis macularius]
MAGSPLPHRSQKQVREETRRVLEAFLQGVLSPRDTGPLGHVGRTYHDPQRYIYRSPTEHAQPCPIWSNVHEEINRVEERKHGFRTSIKRLLQRRPSPRTPPDSLPPSKDSLKRSKSGGEGAHQKRSFSFKSLLRKKGIPSGEMGGPAGPGQRPDSLPLAPCYCEQLPAVQTEPQATNNEAEDTEFYTLVAQKLDHLIKQQQLMSPSTGKGLPSPTDEFRTLSTNSASGTSVNSITLEGGTNEKEQVLQKLVALLEEQAGIINKEIESDPLLRSTISRLSYRSFSRMAEAFTSRAPPGIPSPQLAKLALTMELTRKVAGINSHAVHTLMGYSLQYMDMFVPWLQQQGGWENIVAQDEIFDLQID